MVVGHTSRLCGNLTLKARTVRTFACLHVRIFACLHVRMFARTYNTGHGFRVAEGSLYSWGVQGAGRCRRANKRLHMQMVGMDPVS